MSEFSQAITGRKDRYRPSTSATGSVQQPRLVKTGLASKLFMLPISIIGGSMGLVTGPIRLCLWVPGAVLSYWLSMLRLTSSRCNRRPPLTPPVQVSVSAVAVEESEAIDFLSEFESGYGKTHPNFVPEGFMDAVQQSRREFKLLFVYLHSPDNPDTPSFCKNTLCSEALSELVNENFVSWGYSIRKNEGYEIHKCLKASTFPFWAVIMATTGENISLLRQFEGPSSPEEMVTELQSVLKENVSSLVGTRFDTDQQTSFMPLTEEEDDPHPAAIEADQANEDQNQIEMEAVEPEKEPNVIQVDECHMKEDQTEIEIKVDSEPKKESDVIETNEDENQIEMELVEGESEPEKAFNVMQVDECEMKEDQTEIEIDTDSEFEKELDVIQANEYQNQIEMEAFEAYSESRKEFVIQVKECEIKEDQTEIEIEVDSEPEKEPDVIQVDECEMKEDQSEIEIEVDSEPEKESDVIQANEDENQIEIEVVEAESILKKERDVIQVDECHTKEDQAKIEIKANTEPEKKPDVIQVSVRLPSGERIGKMFYSTATLQSIYDFVDSSDCLDIGSYTLVTFFPRVLYSQDQLSSTLKELGLHPQTSLFVELIW